jgi:hypothetical protein
MNSVSTSIAARAPSAVSNISQDSTLTGGSAMAFVNELVSEDDIRKYALDEVKAKFNSWSWREGRPVGFRHNWTIDRERNVYLMQAKTVEKAGSSGLAEPTARSIWILNWEGIPIRIELEKLPASSFEFSDSPFRVVWALIDMDTSPVRNVSRLEILQVLKDALMTYGYRGAQRQLPNTVVEFSF